MGGPALIPQRILDAGPEVLPRVILAADQAAGQEVVFTVPGGRWWELLTFRTTLTTDATVANRRHTLVMDDGTTIFWHHVFAADQTASVAQEYHWARGLGFEKTTANLSVANIGLPDVPLYPGFRIRTVTSGIVAGDDYSAAALYVLEHPLRGETAELVRSLDRLTEHLSLLGPLIES